MVHVFNAADSQEAVRRIALGNATSLRSHNDLLSVFTSRSSRRRRDYDSESDSSMDTDEEERVAVIHHLQARHDVQIHQIQFQTPCSGLVAALGCAHECKVGRPHITLDKAVTCNACVTQNNLHDRKADQALSSFVEACSTSIFSLAYLATVEQQLVKTLEDAENRVQMLCWDLPASKVNM